jgi:hypothetical protein
MQANATKMVGKKKITQQTLGKAFSKSPTKESDIHSFERATRMARRASLTRAPNLCFLI